MFHCNKQVKHHALTCSHCFSAKHLCSNWKLLYLVTLKTSFLSDELCLQMHFLGLLVSPGQQVHKLVRDTLPKTSALFSSPGLRCISRSSLKQLMAHRKNNAPKRGKDRNQISGQSFKSCLISCSVQTPHIVRQTESGFHVHFIIKSDAGSKMQRSGSGGYCFVVFFSLSFFYATV